MSFSSISNIQAFLVTLNILLVSFFWRQQTAVVRDKPLNAPCAYAKQQTDGVSKQLLNIKPFVFSVNDQQSLLLINCEHANTRQSFGATL